MLSLYNGHFLRICMVWENVFYVGYSVFKVHPKKKEIAEPSGFGDTPTGLKCVHKWTQVYTSVQLCTLLGILFSCLPEFCILLSFGIFVRQVLQKWGSDECSHLTTAIFVRENNHPSPYNGQFFED